MEEFRIKVLEFAKKSMIIKERCKNEESTKMFLIMPFLNMLGYNCSDPLEVSPEHEADFKDKQKARVDYAILLDDKPIIAVECKAVDIDLNACSGQLRNYFTPSCVRMGILTDGIIWKFFADSEKPNVMDEKPFLTLNLEHITKNNICDSELNVLMSLHKKEFNPENIGNEAKRKLVFNSILQQISNLSNNPSDSFCEILLRNAGFTIINQKRKEEYRPIIINAFQDFIENEIMKRLNLKKSEEKDIKEEIKKEEQIVTIENKIITTETEIKAYNLTIKRLLFLCKEENLYNEILNNILYKDYSTKFIIFYKKEQKGRLFEFYENKNDLTFIFPNNIGLENNIIKIKNLSEFNLISDILKTVFEKIYTSYNA